MQRAKVHRTRAKNSSPKDLRRYLRDGEGETISAIPSVVGLIVVRVQPMAIVIAIRAEEVRIAVRNTRKTIYVTALGILSGLYRIRHHNALVSRAKYLLF